MSLDKAINHKKERRKPFYGSKAFDKTCRCHGGCEWCKANRLYKFEKDKPVDDSGKEITKHDIITSILSTSVDGVSG